MRMRIRLIAALLLSAPLACSAPHESEESNSTAMPLEESSPSGGAAIFPLHARPYGHTMVEWSERWSQWIYGVPKDENPQLDPTGEHCGANQSGPVWFLASVTTGGAPNVTRSCTLPEGKAVLFSGGGSLWDYPCPDPAHEPAPGQSLYDFLRQGAKNAVDGISALSVTLDGRSVNEPFDHRFASPRLFQITGHPSLTDVLDPCITGRPQPAVADGYFFMALPLRAGAHTVVTRTTRSTGASTTRTWDLTVVARTMP